MASEADWELIALERLAEHSWEPQPGQAIAPGTDGGRTSWDDLVLRGPLLAAMHRLNPLVPAVYLEQALTEIVAPQSQDAIAENYRLHRILVHGYRGVSYIDSDGIEQNPTIRLVSHRVEDNEWLAVNQVTVRSQEVQRRFDVVLYFNGMPVGVIELKKAGVEARRPSRRRTPSSRPTCASSRWRSASACSRSSATGSPPVRHAVHAAQPLLAVERRRRRAPRRARRPTWPTTGSASSWSSLIDGLVQPGAVPAAPCATSSPSTRVRTGSSKRIAKPHQYFAVTKAVGTHGRGGREQRQGRRRLAHPGLGQVDGDGALRPPGRAAAQAEEPHRRRRHRPHRTRQPALRGVRPHPAAGRDPDAGADPRRSCGRRCATGSPAASTSRPCRSSAAPRAERDAGARPPAALRPAQHHRDRRRGAPQPLRRPRRLRPAPPRRPARTRRSSPSPARRSPSPTATRRRCSATYIDIYDLTRAVEDGATVPVYFEPRLIKVSWPAASPRTSSTKPPTRRPSASTTSSGRRSRSR